MFIKDIPKKVLLAFKMLINVSLKKYINMNCDTLRAKKNVYINESVTFTLFGLLIFSSVRSILSQ